MFDVEVIQVIKTTLERRGKGTDGSDPVRIVEQYWLMTGELLWEVDTWNGQMYSPRAKALQSEYS